MTSFISSSVVTVKGMYPLKRATDIVLSIFLLIITFPIMLIAALVVWLTSDGPVIFKQKRVGPGGVVFQMFKFRTMHQGRHEAEPFEVLRQRCFIPYTPPGKFLRSWSIDELPQLLNVLFGEMSMVGIRPALPNETELLAQRNRLGINHWAVGLTGWYQVNGRKKNSLDQRIALEEEHCRRWGYLFDWKITFKTFFVVLFGDGADG